MLNKTQLIGRLGANPEVRGLNDGAKVANLRLATTEAWKDRETGERQERTEWHRVTVWGDGPAKYLAHATKGSMLLIEGRLPLSTFTVSFLLELQNAWALRGHRAAELRMNVLRNVLNPMLIAADVPDPFARLPGVPSPRKDREPHPAWPERVVERVIHECIELGRPGIARAVAVGRYTGARRGDLVKMLKSAQNERRARWLSGKKRVPVDQPEAPELTAWLSATPAHQPLSRWQRNADRRAGVTRTPSRPLVYNCSDKPYTEGGLGQGTGTDHRRPPHRRRDRQPVLRSSRSASHHGRGAGFGWRYGRAGSRVARPRSPHSFATYRGQASRMLLTNIAGELILKLRAQANGTAAEQIVQNECKEVQNGAAVIGVARR